MKPLQEQIKDLENQLAELKKKAENQPKHQYPIYCLGKTSGTIWEFSDLKTGILRKKGTGFYPEGRVQHGLIPHTNTNHWEVLPICPKTGFYHKQRVWFWDDNNTHVRTQGFYDAINTSAYHYDGSKCGYEWDNYEAVTTHWEDWQIEAFKTLK